MDETLGPDEGVSVVVATGGESVDMGHKFADAAERGALERLASQYREPDLDLVQPRAACRGVVEVDIRVPPQLHVPLRLVGGERSK